MRDAKNRSKKQLLHARGPSIGRLSKKQEREALPASHFKQVITTCDPLDTIFDEIDLLEDDPPHRNHCCAKHALSSVLDTGGGEGMAGPVGKGRL
jgi:hypothetical protein